MTDTYNSDPESGAATSDYLQAPRFQSILDWDMLLARGRDTYRTHLG